MLRSPVGPLVHTAVRFPEASTAIWGSLTVTPAGETPTGGIHAASAWRHREKKAAMQVTAEAPNERPRRISTSVVTLLTSAA
jgi:hypothetical protein